MNLPEFSVKRPVFVTCVFIVILALGYIARTRLTTALYPDVSFPVVNVIVPFPGAGPDEIEQQVSKPLEGALNSLPGIRELRSTNIDSAGIITVVFSMDTDIRFAQQRVIETVSRVRGDLPAGIMEPSIRTVDPSDTPVVTLTLTAQVDEGDLYELADRQVRPLLEQVSQVGLVEILGGRKREVHVDLDEDKLRARQMSAGEVVGRLMGAGKNIPSGEIKDPKRNVLVRTVGAFDSLDAIRNTPVRFVENEILTPVSAVAAVSEGLEDERTRVYIDGKRALTLRVFRQSGGNTVAIADGVQQRVKEINAKLQGSTQGFELSAVRDGAKPIRAAVTDATDAILLGIVLTVLVVLLFLGNLRSTVITGLALPNSLLGAFLLMWAAGFSVNITTLAALSLAVGLLIDDAIVVRENIFRRIEHGEPTRVAAVEGTKEVTLAVVATTFTVLSVFGPVSFLSGIIGQFFREFGLTICFAMMISLLDSLTVAPMLSAYFAGVRTERRGPVARLFSTVFAPLRWLITALERFFIKAIHVTLRHPLLVLALAATIFGLSFVVLERLPKTFVPSMGSGEFQVVLDTPAGTSLQQMDTLSNQADATVRQDPDVARTVLTVGGENGETNQAQILVLLKDAKERKHTTDQAKDEVRKKLQPLTGITSRVEDLLDVGGGAGRPFVLKITGDDLEQLKQVSSDLIAQLNQDPDLKDVARSYRPGAKELQFKVDPKRAREYGVSSAEVGQELRILLSGTIPATMHAGGKELDVRVRLREDQRDLRKSFGRIAVPNLNHRMLPLSQVAEKLETDAPAVIQRQDRERFIEVNADVASGPGSHGLAYAINTTKAIFSPDQPLPPNLHHVKLPPGVRYQFAGQTKDFEDLLSSVFLAVGLSVGFMYLVLAVLYESFFVPFSIMLVLPLAVCGAFYALWIGHLNLDIYSMIGCVLLMGVAAKNSILLVDYIHEGVQAGKDVSSAILHAGEIRVRPILMTSFALIAGMLPVAIPTDEAAASRASMAIAVIGGVVSSTVLTLVVVPAAYEYILRFQRFVLRLMHRGGQGPGPGAQPPSEVSAPPTTTTH